LLIPAERDFNVRWPVLEDPTAHTVVIESASIDLSQAILDPAPNYEVMIFCDIKAPDTPAGLEFGPNFSGSQASSVLWISSLGGFKTSCSRKPNLTT
jgi:hypothetical protein